MTGSHKAGLVGLVLVPSSTLKTNWKTTKNPKPKNKGGGQHRLMCTQKKRLTELVFRQNNVFHVNLVKP